MDDEIAAGEPLRLGDYDLLERLGQGGMGVVYRARHRPLNRLVALKIISAGELAAPDFVERFRIEAEAAASLDHPNIVPIYEIGREGERHFFAMKLAEGGTLANRPGAGSGAGLWRSSNEEVARLMACLAQAVHYAHQRGVLHRDIKPDNVLLDTSGKPLLSDFGLAKLIDQDSQLTRTLAVLGTPAYIAPEQAAGAGTPVTTATDVYGLGAVLYELLTGRPPFAGHTAAATLRQVLEQDPVRLSHLQPAIHQDLETICLKCLEKNPASRYGSALALAEDLERWLRHEPIEARPATAIERVVKWVRRHPAYSALITVVAVSLVSIALISNIARARVAAALQESEAQKSRIQQSRRELATSQASTARQLGSSLFLQGIHAAEARQNGPALAYWAHALRVDPLHRGAASRIFHTLSQCRFLQPAIPPLVEHRMVSQCAITPDGERVAIGFQRETNQVWIRDAHTGRLLHRIGLGKPCQRLAMSPDGQYLATAAGLPGNGPGSVQLWEVATGTAASPAIPTPEGIEFLNFSPDGHSIAFTIVNALLYVADVPSGRIRLEPRSYPPSIRTQTSPVWAPDSRSVYAGVNNTRIVRYDATTGNILATWQARSDPLSELHLSPDGARMITLTGRKVPVYDTSTGSVVQWLTHEHSPECMAISPQGDTVAIAKHDGTIRLWNIKDATVKATFDAVTPQRHMVFSLDGTSLASHGFDNALRLWDVRSGESLCEPALHEQTITTIAFHPDGRGVVSGSRDGAVHFWKLSASHRSEQRLPHDDGVRRATFSPSQHLIATATLDRHVRVWRRSGELLSRSGPFSAPVASLQFSRDDRRLLVSYGRHAEVRDAHSGQPIGPALDQETQMFCVLAPDGETVVGGSQSLLHFWDARSGAERLPPTRLSHPLRDVRLTPDGTRIATVITTAEVDLWNLTNGQHLATFQCEGSPRAVRFARDGRTMVAIQPNGFVVFDVATGRLLRRGRAAAAEVKAGEINEDASRVALKCFDNCVRIFDGRTGELVAPPSSHRPAINGLMVDPAGGRYAITGSNGRVEVFDIATARSWTGPLWHDDSRREDSAVAVHTVEFSDDGGQLLTAGEDGTARLWELGVVSDELAPDWLPAFAEAIGGLRLHAPTSAKDTLQLIPVSYRDREALRARMATAPGTNRWIQVARLLSTNNFSGEPSSALH